MELEQHHVTAVPLPLDSEITRTYPMVNFADAYSVELPAGASTNPELLARFVFSQLSPWMTALMKTRDALVAGFGLKTIKHLTLLGEDANASRVGFFKIYSTGQTEIVLGEDDKHLDFRLSLLCSSQSSSKQKRYLILSTVVHCHNRLGRLYILLIAPFHRLIVRSLLRRSARAGWPLAKMT